MFRRRRKNAVHPQEQSQHPSQPSPQSQPRWGAKEFARTRELLVAARVLLNEEIQRLRLVEQVGTVDDPGMVDPWHGAERLYEETYSDLVNWDRPEWGTRTTRRTPGYFLGIRAPGPGREAWRSYVQMTVSSEGRVELTGSNSLDARPATVEELKALLKC